MFVFSLRKPCMMGIPRESLAGEESSRESYKGWESIKPALEAGIPCSGHFSRGLENMYHWGSPRSKGSHSQKRGLRESIIIAWCWLNSGDEFLMKLWRLEFPWERLVSPIWLSCSAPAFHRVVVICSLFFVLAFPSFLASFPGVSVVLLLGSLLFLCFSCFWYGFLVPSIPDGGSQFTRQMENP